MKKSRIESLIEEQDNQNTTRKEKYMAENKFVKFFLCEKRRIKRELNQDEANSDNSRSSSHDKEQNQDQEKLY